MDDYGYCVLTVVLWPVGRLYIAVDARSSQSFVIRSMR